MRKLLSICFIAIVVLVLASAEEYVEIRGPMAHVVNTSYSWGPQEYHGDFAGFFYDIDDNIGTETITLTITEGRLDGLSSPPAIQYKSYPQDKRFKFRDWGRYRSIGFLGENYFAGYSSSPVDGSEPFLFSKSRNRSLIAHQQLTKVLIDTDEEMTLYSGTSLELAEGYELILDSIDLEGSKANVRLAKDGRTIVSSVVSPSKDGATMEDKTFYYKTNIGEAKDIVTIAIHFKNAYRSSEEELVTIDGIFQISDRYTAVNLNQKFERMRVSIISENEIAMDNKDNTITLYKNTDVQLMPGIYIRTADRDATQGEPLKFYIYRKIEDPGTYEVRGKLEYAVDQRDVSWNVYNFPGFFYDLDDDLGTERLDMHITGNPLGGQAGPGNISYTTSAQEKEFDQIVWGRYYTIGFLGDQYFAGYVRDAQDEKAKSYLWHTSEDRNLLGADLLSKVLIDNNEEFTLHLSSIVPLREGYKIVIQEIDPDAQKVRVNLLKDGNPIDEKVVTLNEDMMSTYCYRKTLGSVKNIVLIAVHFKNAFRGEMDIATVDGIWQISETPENVEIGREIGMMQIRDVNPLEGQMKIEMENSDRSISLRGDKDVALMADFHIKTADQEEISDADPLRFYVYRAALIGPAEQIVPDAEKKEEAAEEKKPPSTPGFETAAGAACILAAYLNRRLG